jgi:tetratricopeptide (TPR) repeat protein
VLNLLEDVLIYRPHDPDLNDRAARVWLQLGKLDLASGYVETLIERTPDSAACHTLAGRIYRERNDLDAAVIAFETALKLDEDDLDARRALASLRIGARNAARGGT